MGDVQYFPGGTERFGEVFQRIQQELDGLTEDVLVDIVLTGTGALSKEMKVKLDNGDLLEALQADYDRNGDLRWIHTLRRAKDEGDRDPEQDPFLGEVIETLEGMNGAEWEEALADLYEHPSIYRFLDPLDEGDKRSLIEETEQLLSYKG